METNKLLKGVKALKVWGKQNVSVLGITEDSRQIKKGYLFCAFRGHSTDGHKFIKEAFDKGAEVVICEKKPVGLDVKNNQMLVEVEDAREALGNIASNYYGNPSQKLKIIGVTGTKGKTTTSYYIYQILSELGIKCGLVSSVSALIGDESYDTGFHVTNPDCVSLNEFLAKMVKKGCTHAVLEVSSHGIDQKRIAGIEFLVSVLTNVAPEHLDYHKTFKKYRDVKVSFLKSSPFVVINRDDSNYSYVKMKLDNNHKIFSYSYQKNLSNKLNKHKILEKILGVFNKLNFLAAMTVCLALGYDQKKLLNLNFVPKLPEGRLDEVPNNLGIKIIVDFAHTPDSLSSVLKYLKGTTKGRLISVFGCAGERDTRKRPQMGKIAGKMCDLTILTAEDPRSEKVEDIISQILKGVSKSRKDRVVSIPDRQKAITYALSESRFGDTVGIFGKGHEKSMNLDGKTETPWSDYGVINDFLEKYPIKTAVILAGGKGTRMNSDSPKVLHNILGKPMVSYSIDNLKDAGFNKIIMLVGFKKEAVMKKFGNSVEYAFQNTPLGTGDAAYSAVKNLPKKYSTVLVVNGDDSAFYKPSTLSGIYKYHVEKGNVLTFATSILKNPFGIGRVERDKENKILRIVEEKDANNAQKQIKECNIGLYVFDAEWLRKSAKRIPKSASGEYYIVSLIEIAIKEGEKISNFEVSSGEFHGVNTPDQLIKANLKMKKNKS